MESNTMSPLAFHVHAYAKHMVERSVEIAGDTAQLVIAQWSEDRFKILGLDEIPPELRPPLIIAFVRTDMKLAGVSVASIVMKGRAYEIPPEAKVGAVGQIDMQAVRRDLEANGAPAVDVVSIITYDLHNQSMILYTTYKVCQRTDEEGNPIGIILKQMNESDGPLDSTKFQSTLKF